MAVKIGNRKSKLPNYSNPVNDSLNANAGLSNKPSSGSSGKPNNSWMGGGALQGFANTAADAYKAGIGGGALQGFLNLFSAPKAQAPKKAAAKPSAPQVASQQPYSMADALNDAQNYLSGMGADPMSKYNAIMAGVPDYTPLIQQTQQTFGDATNRLQAMYNALHNSFQGDAPAVGGVFDQAKTADQQTADSTTGAINSAYDSARAAQTKQFSDLGIGDALANIVSNGAGTTTGDQANALSRVATSNQASQNQLDTNKSAALNYNTGIANSALQGGTDRAAQLQNQMAAAVAQIQQQQSNAYNSAHSQAVQAAESGPSASDISSLAQSLFNGNPNTQQYVDKTYLAQQKNQQQSTNNLLNSLSKLGNNNQATPLTPQQIVAIINQWNGNG